MTTDESMRMEATMNYTDEGDRLLREAGAAHLTERALDAQWRNVTVTEHIEEVAAAVVDESRYSGHIDAGLTRRQCEVLRCARLCRRRAQAEGRALTVIVAEEMGINRFAAWKILERVRERIEARRRMEEPSPWVQRAWHSEIRAKKRMIYRRPKRGWISAYCWSRKRWKDRREEKARR
jgi:hypothetical protein